MASVSIVIPTKNRAHCARWTISACLRLGERCEVVVADSAADEYLRDTLSELGLLEKIIYVRTSPEYSVVENFNEAIKYATGEFVTCIGDDDIVTSAIFDVAKYAESNAVECVTFSYALTYWWPDFVHRRRGTIDSASVGAGHFTGTVQKLNPIRELKNAASKLGTGPQNMPRIYAGLVKRSVLERISEKYGALFGGVSPDVYSSTLLARECKSMVHIDYPVIVPGLSGGSTSGASSNGTHLGKLRENSHIAPFRNLEWDIRVPEYYSVPTVWSFSMLKALEKIDAVEQANFLSLYAKCFLYTRGFNSDIVGPFRQYAKARGLGVIADGFRTVRAEIAFFLSAISRRVVERMVSSKFQRYEGCMNSQEAADKIEKLLIVRPFVGCVDGVKQ